jgi:DNA repair photolyase
MTKRRTGTKEWATHNKNINFGCKNNCKYCYARANALRFKQIKSSDEWTNMRLYEQKEKPRHIDGRIMFPSSHDLMPEYIEEILDFLNKWLGQGNDFLIVSKPRLEVIDRLTKELERYKEQITFRFTIGSMDDNVLHFWEPDAPLFSERMASLRLAFERGYKTSVSCEPFFDKSIFLMIDNFSPYVTDTIWIGKMNGVNQRVDTSKWIKDDFKYLTLIEKGQSDDMIKSLYEHFKTHSKIKWKDSIKSILGLPEEEIG